MTPFKAIYHAADRANAAEMRGDYVAHAQHSAEVHELILKRLAELRASHATEDKYPVVQFEREPNEHLLDDFPTGKLSDWEDERNSRGDYAAS